MKIALQLTLAFLGMASLIGFAVYVYLANRGLSPLLYSSADVRLLTLPKKIFFGFAAMGLLTCVFQGAEAMLWWIPGSWGSNDEYGEFTSFRVQFAGAFTFIAGIAFIIFIDRSAHTDFFLRNANIEQQELKKIIDAYESRRSMEILLQCYATEMEKLEKQLSSYGEAGHSAMTYAFPEGQLLLLYRDLQARVQRRIEQLKAEEK